MKKVGVSHLGLVFGEGMVNNRAGEKEKKKGKMHSKWANEQTIITELCIPFYLLVHAFVYYYKCVFVCLILQVMCVT